MKTTANATHFNTETTITLTAFGGETQRNDTLKLTVSEAGVWVRDTRKEGVGEFISLTQLLQLARGTHEVAAVTSPSVEVR